MPLDQSAPKLNGGKEIERPWHIRQEIKSVFHNKLLAALVSHYISLSITNGFIGVDVRTSKISNSLL